MSLYIFKDIYKIIINMVNLNDIMNIVNVNDITNYIFTTRNLCRVIFYTPIIFISSVVGSVIYDYITFKDNDDDKKKSK